MTDETLGGPPADDDHKPAPVVAASPVSEPAETTGEALVFEWLHQRPDGTQWDAEVHLMRFEAQGRMLLQFTLHDITGRKAAEVALPLP